MSTAISRLFIVESKLAFKMSAGDALDARLRRAVSALGDYQGATFAAEGRRASAFLRGEATATRISLVHPRFSDEAGFPNSWLSLAIDKYDSLGVIFLGIHVGRPGEQVDLEWDIGRAIVPRLVNDVAPTVAFMNGRLVDVERGTLPGPDAFEAPGLPREFTPWTYVHGERLTAEVRHQLSRLPAAHSESFGEGWIVQAIDRLTDQEPSAFVSALNDMSDSPIRYRGPILTSGR